MLLRWIKESIANNFPVTSMIGQLMWLLFPLKKQRDIKNSLVQVPPKIDYNRLSGGETQAQACFHSSSQFWCASRVENHCGRHSAIVESLSHVQLFLAPWTAAHQASLSFTTSQSLFKLMSIESVMPSNHLILCCPLLLLPSVFPSSSSHEVTKVLELQLQHQSFQWIFRVDFL